MFIPFVLLAITFFSGNFLHILANQANNILTNADSFAYLQMSYFLKQGMLQGLGTGWFGFLYSGCIAIVNIFITNDYLAGQLTNIILLNIGGLLLFLIGNRYLNVYYNILLVIIYFFSSSLLNYSMSILSENLFIPLFLLLFLCLHRFIEYQSFLNALLIGFVSALLYFTRSESFIYLFGIVIIGLLFMMKKIISWKKFFRFGSIILLSFFIFIAPYVYYLHTVTGEWGLTNKGTSNIRQALMRDIQKMDDEGFEKAVGELTSDNHHLISGFVGGLKYEKPSEEYSLQDTILKDKKETFSRFIANQKKIYTEIIPKMLIGNFLAYSESAEFLFPTLNTHIKGLIIFLPFIFLVIGGMILFFRKQYFFFSLFLPLFFIASFFFSIFFILERYFIIFLPLLLLIMVYGTQEILVSLESLSVPKYIIFVVMFGFIFYFGSVSFLHSIDTKKYEVKEIAGNRLQRNLSKLVSHDKTQVKIMERFPITTYYSGTKERWLVPYTSRFKDIMEYAKYNKIDFLIVDSLDFKTYRSDLFDELTKSKTLLKLRYPKLKYINTFTQNDEKVLIYKFNY